MLVVGYHGVLVVIDVRALALADQAQVGVISTQLSIFVNKHPTFQSLIVSHVLSHAKAMLFSLFINKKAVGP